MNLPEHCQRVEFIPNGCKHPVVGIFYYVVDPWFHGPHNGWKAKQVTEWRGVDETEWTQIGGEND